jgi:endonuclease YncB( thermonuclease family)
MNLTSWEEFTEDNVPPFSLGGKSHFAKVSSVYDGDTVKCIFGFGGEMFVWNCRISGVDTPELRTRNVLEKAHGYVARDRLRELILGKVVLLKCGEFDKYGRLLIDIELSDGTNVSKWLVQEGLAFEYDGGTKRSWEEYLKEKTEV